MARSISTRARWPHANSLRSNRLMDATRYFVGVAARDAVDAAVAGGYVEVNHGKAGPLERMHDGDALVYYSPRTGERGAALQAFTAIARIVGDVLYQAGAAGDTLRPFRRGAIYASAQPPFALASPASVLPAAVAAGG